MGKNRYIGMYFNETELMNRVDELKREGWPEDDIYVVVKNEDQLTMVRSRTDAEIKSADDSWWDRFMGFVSGEDHVRRMVDSLEFGTEDTVKYYQEIEQGGMLLYVDSGEANRHYMDNTDFYGRDGKSTDVNLGANGLSVTDQELNGGDPAFRLSQTLPDQTLNHQNHEVDPAIHTNEHALSGENTEEESLRLHEERLQVDKHETQRGEIRVEKEVVEEPRSVDVSVSHDEVTIERRPVVDGEIGHESQYVNDATAFREDDETIRIPITEERVEVTKKPVVTEEIILKKREVVENETIHETVKREEVHFEKEGEVDIQGDQLDKDRF
ncbi:hypothetical protein CSV69_10900 [Sporosarcina sp. P26b]|uniref:YsnF/AvaK domain-containing protein n=1 Tax=Sporosarcina TaxID=1569 RepID=UPI000A17FB64|nr:MULTISPECIES: YsnF/AvaK domain-containing protein [Sporosarcina]ARK21153.1 hypothetical protein SporoP32a_06210 [Sporosarcina ureae]PIC95570.1 hypothetical protein CSV69_10900 [Sporosarcina sp. P26b]